MLLLDKSPPTDPLRPLACHCWFAEMSFAIDLLIGIGVFTNVVALLNSDIFLNSVSVPKIYAQSVVCERRETLVNLIFTVFVSE